MKFDELDEYVMYVSMFWCLICCSVTLVVFNLCLKGGRCI